MSEAKLFSDFLDIQKFLHSPNEYTVYSPPFRAIQHGEDREEQGSLVREGIGA